MRKRKKTIAARKRAMKVPVKKCLKCENTSLSKFIKAFVQKNYSEASKYLTTEIENKLKARISQSL